MTLRVVLQIIPDGDEEHAREIGRLDISRAGSAEFGHSRYRVVETNERAGYLHDREVLHRPHLGAWALVKKVLDKLDVDKP
jgi:hypothetical protein